MQLTVLLFTTRSLHKNYFRFVEPCDCENSYVSEDYTGSSLFYELLEHDLTTQKMPFLSPNQQGQSTEGWKACTSVNKTYSMNRSASFYVKEKGTV